jgi:hypothetical protein
MECMIFMCCLLRGSVVNVALLYGVAKLQRFRRSQIVSAPAFRAPAFRNPPIDSEKLFLGQK